MLTVGALVEDDVAVPGAPVGIPLAMMNRHGLVAGATGTGKTKTLQVLAEGLSAAGVPVFVADIKGDLSGLAVPGTSSEKLLARTSSLGQDWVAPRRPWSSSASAASARARRCGPRSPTSGRCCWQGARPQRHAGVEPRA